MPSSVDWDGDGDVFALIEVDLGPRVDMLHPVASRWPLSIDLVASGLVPKFFKKLVSPGPFSGNIKV